MNKDKITVVICCAGMGTRLGIGSTKALLDIDGEPLILRLLKLLDDYSDIRVVVGYQAEKLINTVNSYRKDVIFVFNYEFSTGGIVKSFSKALPYAREYIIQLDGDLLINPDDFKEFLDYPQECLAVTSVHSDNPILVDVQDSQVIEFMSNKGQAEWIGILKLKRERLSLCGEYIFEMVRPCLPVKSVFVRARDIDTADDYENALRWFHAGMKD